MPQRRHPQVSVPLIPNQLHTFGPNPKVRSFARVTSRGQDRVRQAPVHNSAPARSGDQGTCPVHAARDPNSAPGQTALKLTRAQGTSLARVAASRRIFKGAL